MRKWLIFAPVVLGVAVVPFWLHAWAVAPSRASSSSTAPAGAARLAPLASALHHLDFAPPSPSAASALDPELQRLFARLTDAPNEKAYQDAVSAVYFELTARLRAHPELVGKLETMLAHGDRHLPAVRIAVGALAGAGTPEAQSALVRLLDARAGDHSFMTLLVPTMGFAAQPTPALQDALGRLAASDQPKEVRDMADLALGASVARLGNQDPARARRIVDGYDEKLSAAKSPDEMGTYLSVLGNAATPEAAQVVSRYLHDDRQAVRTEALKALRRVPTAEAEADLTQALRDDPDGQVRASAAWALSYRRPSAATTQAEASALSDERDSAVARQLLENLWDARGAKDSGALAAITAAAESHPVAAVREQARKLLAQAAPTGSHF